MRKVIRLEFLNQAKQKIKRIIYAIERKKIIHILHIGKTGGSAVRYAIEQYTKESCYGVLFHPHKTRLADVPNGEKVIFFLRDPISRFISGFYSRQRQGHPRYFNSWSKNEKISFEEFNTPNQLAIGLSAKNAVTREKAQFAMKNITHVKDSYLYWFESVDYFQSRLSDILFIGFQERLTKDFNALKIKIGLSENAQLPSDDVIAHKHPEHLDKTLDIDAVINLKKWYKNDYQIFISCKELIENQPLIFRL